MLNNWKVDASLVTLGFFTVMFFMGFNLNSHYMASPSTGTQSQPPLHSAQMPPMNMTNKKSESTNGPIPTNANEILIENFSFKPATLNVKAGTKVTWVNRDDEPHTATDDEQRFNSKTLDTNDQFSFTFTQPGTYNYFCALHPKMRGQIIVK